MNPRPRHILVSLLCVFFALTGRGQFFDFSFEHLTSDDGLSNDIVNCIVKDRTGFMWFGTNDGLNRYDGRNFHVIKPIKNDSTGIPSGYISSMAVDRNGWIWLTTNRGLCKFSPELNEFKMIPFPGNDRNKLVSLSNVLFQGDYVWFLSDQYLYKMEIETNRFKKFDLPTRESYFGVFTDKKGRIWVYLRNGLYGFNEATGKFKYYGGLNNLNPNDKLLFGPAITTKSDTLFIPTYGNGLFYYDEKKDQFLKWKKANNLLVNAVEDFTETGRRFFWCQGGVTGLMIYDPVADKFHSMMNNPRDPYTHNATESTAIFKDSATGTVWISTKVGVEKYDPYSLRFRRKFLPPSVGYSNFAMLGEVIKDRTDPTGNIFWAGSWAIGLLRWNREDNEFRIFNMENAGLVHNEVFHVTQSKFGYLILACRDGVTLFDPRTERVIKKIKDFFVWPISRKILYVNEDSEGNIWMVANYDGVYEYDLKSGKVRHWDLPGVLPEKGPFLTGTIQEDRNENIWIAGFTSETFVIDHQTDSVKIISDNKRKGKKLPSHVTALHIGKWSKEIWVSGAGNYLAQLDEAGEIKKIIRERDAEDGAGYNVILQDPLGYIWASAENYIQRINTKDGSRDFFGKEDGLVSSAGIHGASITDEGELFLGFQYAFCHINTIRIPFNTTPPVLAISSTKVNYRTRYLGDHTDIQLNPDERVLTLEFAALNFSQPQRNRFAYKLEGYDDDWMYANDHDITLMNLEGGTHWLHIKASNNDGVWSKEMKMKIKVIPPFHKTIWFKLMLAVMIGTLAYLIIWYRKQHRRKLEKIRQRIATDLHDDMGSTLSSIRIFSDVAKKQVEEVKPETVHLLDRISNNATSLSENMQDIIWTIRNDNDTLEDLVSRMREFGLRVCDAKHIRFKVQVSQNFKTSKLSLEQRRNIYLIFKEVINNAVKYSECTEISLFLTQQGRYLKMEISDNGKGFNVEHVKRGNGLNNLEKRAKEINGNISVESKAGEGTVVDLMAVLKREVSGL